MDSFKKIMFEVALLKAIETRMKFAEEVLQNSRRFIRLILWKVKNNRCSAKNRCLDPKPATHDNQRSSRASFLPPSARPSSRSGNN